ncbi:membrane protein [Dictyobacter alpinus]|uniref:Membrane protein n=2 Tax=Dictyobacter alpinus TaxID=2014873 RepID=A0A402B4N1_9CHLR|nr:membrane protein [Dictyobacter alpinus]
MVVIGWVLQIGVLVSAVIIVLGVGLYFLHPSGQAGIQIPHTLIQIFQGVLAFQPEAIIALGLIVLIATPVVRVAISILGFALEHDRTFALISLLVLLILLVSFFLGKGGA